MVFKDISKPALFVLNLAIKIAVPFQVLMLHLFYWAFGVYFKFNSKDAKKRKVAIGVTEAARLIYALGKVFPSSYRCVLDGSRFYKDDYDFGPYRVWYRPVMGPLILAYLAHLSETFIYISFTGYLADREQDLKFLKSKGKKIVMLFYGSDIRSLTKTKEYFDSIEEDTFVNYLPNLFNPLYDKLMQRNAELADKYADLIFNWRVDQIGYLTKKTIPWPYIFELKDYPYKFSLPANKDEMIVLHCPSHNVVKGTPLVRAAVKKLKMEGFKFKYVELYGVPNSEVIENLRNCHIVLQEFYCLTPGILGIEAMASGTAVLMSASHKDNDELPTDSDEAWLPTLSWQIYDKLKELLENPDKVQKLAENGRKFVEKHYDLNVVTKVYQDILTENNIPF